MKFLDIAVSVPLNQTFTYKFDENESSSEGVKAQNEISIKTENIQTELFAKRKRIIKKTETIIQVPQIGKRAEIRFGNRRTVGYIIGIHDNLPENCPVEEGKIRPVSKILDSESLFGEELLSLFNWRSNFNHVAFRKKRKYSRRIFLRRRNSKYRTEDFIRRTEIRSKWNF